MYSVKIQVHKVAFAALGLLGFISAQSVGSKDLFRCRQSCYQKFVQDWHHCMDFEDCKNMCITPPNINSYIPEAFSFLCWNNCDQQLGPFPLNINSALRQGSLVITDIAWDQAITNASKQCLVTWEVSGGGLMGNLLTDSSTVELSLWSDTVYHVQVTCKHKETGGMRRSFKLIVDTHKLGDSSATSMQAISMESQFGNKHLPVVYGAENMPTSPSEAESRLRILKDSSKDFLTPYNPSANAKVKTTDSVNQQQRTIDAEENEVAPHDSVLRTKLVAAPTSSDSLSFASHSLIMAAIGAVIVAMALAALYLIMRPARKQVPQVVCPIDKQVLIHTEILPNQVALQPAPVHQSSPAATKPAVPDQRSTLHV
uniref:Transmembrane protein fend n=1 Tax=Stomoxys calcitrans TaxID=35570 RepID=A0A1I8PZA3_STOCA